MKYETRNMIEPTSLYNLSDQIFYVSFGVIDLKSFLRRTISQT